MSARVVDLGRIGLLLIVAGFAVGPRAAAQTDGAPAADPHEHLGEILSRPLYQRWKLRQERAQTRKDVGSVKSVQALLDRIDQWLTDFFDWLFRGRRRARFQPWNLQIGGFTGLLKLAGWIGLAALVGLLACLLYKVLLRGGARAPAAQILSREQVQAALADGEALAMDGPGWLAEADRLAGERDFRAVYRALYLALLSGLHTRGWIDFRKSRTNWTYVSRFRGPDGNRDTFSALTALFDEVWYGWKVAQQASLASLKAQVTSLLSAEVRRE